MTPPTPLPVTEKKEECPACGSKNKREFLWTYTTPENFGCQPYNHHSWHNSSRPTGEPSAALDVKRLARGARQWLCSGGGGFEDGEAGIRAVTLSGESVVELLDEYAAFVLAKQKEAEGRK